MPENIVQSPALEALANVSHGFFTRRGGASKGIYRSNNCAFGSEDSTEDVQRNRAANAAALGLESIVTVKQQHTSDVVTVTEPWPHQAAPVADALVTDRCGFALGILTADCAPVLLADPGAGVIGAAHAGWKGASGGVLANTVTAMEKLGAKASNIIAAVGPCIAQASYEVGPEFKERFAAMDTVYEKYFTAPKLNGHVHFDLPGFVCDRLRTYGVQAIHVQGSDTCLEEDTFFSYRRSVLKGEPDYGRQISAIGLLPT